MILNGSDILVFINDGVNDIPIACQRGASIDISDELIDTTCKQSSGYSTSLGGKRGFTINCDALVDFDDNLGTEYTIKELFSAYENKTKLTINVANPLFTNLYFVLEAEIESIEVNAPMEDVVSYTATFQGTGILQSLVS